MDDVVLEHGHLVVGSDFGAFTSSDNGGTWGRLETTCRMLW